jgi:pyruvate-formate lyase-activating enzyme
MNLPANQKLPVNLNLIKIRISKIINIKENKSMPKCNNCQQERTTVFYLGAEIRCQDCQNEEQARPQNSSAPGTSQIMPSTYPSGTEREELNF